MNGLAIYAWVAIGGGLGSAARFWMTGWAAGWDHGRLPWGTLLVNILGSLIIGIVAGLTLTPGRPGWHPDLRIFLMAGVCGGFTTFSAFSLQSVEMIQSGDIAEAFCYAAASVVLCLAATWAGLLLAH